jgi:hypothetical protein
MSAIERLLAMKPFEENKGAFMEAMREALKFHYDNCQMFRRFCEKNGFNPEGDYSLEEIPFFPVSLFKTLKLISVDEKEIVKDVSSSSTTSGIPSRIYLDSITAKRQSRALNAIMSSFMGPERRVLIVFDSPETVKSSQGNLSSRGTAIRGMLPFSKGVHFVLDGNLNLDMEALEKALSSVQPGEKVCFLGFTYLIYQILEKHKNDKEAKGLFSKTRGSLVLHLGGWKKLAELRVDKARFNQDLAAFLNTDAKGVMDIYGMVEQLGTIYPDCEYGLKHVPAYSDIIIRDVETLKPAEKGRQGFIQLLSPMPHSYPGVSVISDDTGVIVPGRCRCGRKGKAFLFKSRAEKAELKGCGDTLAPQEG